MAIVKRKSKYGYRYQAKVKGTDGAWITETFETKMDAEQWSARLLSDKRDGKHVSNIGRHMTVNEYFKAWFHATKTSRVSDGWRASQMQMFRQYVAGGIGNISVKKVTPYRISRVIRVAASAGKAAQTQLHIYNLLHKMFEDAIELFELLDVNPVKKRGGYLDRVLCGATGW